MTEGHSQHPVTQTIAGLLVLFGMAAAFVTGAIGLVTLYRVIPPMRESPDTGLYIMVPQTSDALYEDRLVPVSSLSNSDAVVIVNPDPSAAGR